MPIGNRALVLRWIEEVFNQGNMAAADELTTADYVHHDPLMPEMRGIEALKQLVSGIRASFPEGRYVVDELIEEGDKVVLRYTFRGTQKGEWIGVAATNLFEEVTGTTTVRLTQGKIAECWAHWDSLGWMQRVGAASAALIRRWIEEVASKGNLDVIDEIFADDAVFGATLIPEMRGPAAFKRLVTAVRKAFPDIRYSLLGEPVVHGDRCSYRWTASGTHRGEFLGIAPTGKYVTHIGTGTYRVRAGKITELWADWDALGLMQQLGAVPAIGQLSVAAGR